MSMRIHRKIRERERDMYIYRESLKYVGVYSSGFRIQVQGSGYRLQGSDVRGGGCSA